MSAKTTTNDLPGAERTSDGVVYNGFLLEPVIEKCEGCDRVREFDGDQFCASYPVPSRKWHLGACNFATHVSATIDHGKVKVNPLKASKRAARGR
jgi:hypothetical protein